MVKQLNVLRRVFILDGVRTPFVTAGAQFKDVQAYHLLAHAFKALANRNNITKSEIDYVYSGQSIYYPENRYIARNGMLAAGLDVATPANTIFQACLASNQAVTTSVVRINNTELNLVVAGGVDISSDPSVRFIRPMRAWINKYQRAKTNKDKRKMLRQLTPSMVFGQDWFKYDEFSTGESWIDTCKRLEEQFNVSQDEKIAYAKQTFDYAYQAQNNSKLKDVVPLILSNETVGEDSLLSCIKSPVDLRPVQQTNFAVDGASATLVAQEETAIRLGLKPEMLVKDFCYTATDVRDSFLGMASSIYTLLTRNNLAIKDIGVFEMQEVTAGQVIANLKALDSESFSQKQFGNRKLGLIPRAKINQCGGSLVFGNPSGATGSRLINMACSGLKDSRERYAVVANCAHGGLGHAMLLERVNI